MGRGVLGGCGLEVGGEVEREWGGSEEVMDRKRLRWRLRLIVWIKKFSCLHLGMSLSLVGVFSNDEGCFGQGFSNLGRNRKGPRDMIFHNGNPGQTWKVFAMTRGVE